MKTTAAHAKTSLAKRRLLATSALTLASLLTVSHAFAASPGPNQTPNSDINGLNWVAPTTSDASITFTQSPGLLKVDATKVANSSIHWQSGNLGSASTWEIDQQSAASRSANFIGSADGTTIAGHVISNGTVLLFDKNGVFFTDGAVLNVAGIVATTGKLDAANEARLLNGQSITISDIDSNPNASVVNAGAINVADSGLAALVAPFVTNTGTIKAKLGKVTLASGSAVTVDFTGDQLIQIILPTGNGLVQHSGAILANGGVVTLAASTAKGALDTVVNTTGIITANAVSTHDGKIVLSGGGARTKIAGTISASGGVKVASATVDITGNVLLDKGTFNIDASTLNLNGTIFDKTGVTVRGADRLSGDALTINILSASASIQQGVTFAANGSTVTVSNVGGTYFGNITIDKSLTLQGDGSQAVLAGTQANGKIINVTADGVTVQGLELDGQSNSAYGVYAAGVGNLNILGNFIHSVLKDGIHLENAGVTPVLDQNPSFNGDDGDGQIIHGTLTPGGGPILISGNRIDYTGRDGIQSVNSSNVTITDNTIGGTIGGSNGIGRYGIDISGGGNVSVGDENYVYDTVNDAIHAENVNGLSVFGNDLSRIGQDGMDISGSRVILISNNTIQQTQQNGIQLADLTGEIGAQVSDNTLCQIGENGISVSNAPDVVISGNTIRTTGTNWIYQNGGRGGASGIKLTDTDGAQINDNKISGADLDGILVSSSDNLSIDGNTIRRYNDAGIQLANSGTVTISNNTITGDGITFYGEGDYSSGPTTTGIRLWAGTTQPSQDTRIAFIGSSNSPTGGNDNVTLTNNTVKDNATGLDGSNFDNGKITLAGNTFNDNSTGAWFGSGLIDLTGATNTFNGGDTALLFQRATKQTQTRGWCRREEGEGEGFSAESSSGIQYANLQLAGDTLGTTAFKGQSTYFVDLENGAFFDGSSSTTGQSGSPVIIDGSHANWDGVPGGLMTSAQLASIETKIHDFVDDPAQGLIFPGFTNGINDKDVFHALTDANYLRGKLTVIITGLPGTKGGGGTNSGNLANIEPAAGGDGGGNTALGFAKLEPGAGGGTTTAACWTSAIGSATGGNVVAINLGGTQGEILAAAASCGGSL